MFSKELRDAVVDALGESYFPLGSGRVGYIHLECEEWSDGRTFSTTVRAVELIKWRGVENTRQTVDEFGILTDGYPTMVMIMKEMTRPDRVPIT